MSWPLSPEIRGKLKDLAPLDCYEQGALNLEKVAQKLGVTETILAEFKSDDISGLLNRIDSEKWVIYVNASDSPKRRRFTIAHELGHLISYLYNGASKSEIDNNGKIADYAFATRTGDINPVEAEANAIAASLLMPESTVISLYSDGKTVEEMADYFQVSESAMLIRLGDKDLVEKLETVPFETIVYGSQEKSK